MTGELLYKSAIELRELIAGKAVSPVELLEHSLARRDEVDPALNCFVTRMDDSASEHAKAAEKAILDGEELGLLHGLPISIKDLIAVGGVRLTFGSKPMENNIAAVDAPSVRQAKRQGAVVIGKSTTSEFGCKPVGDSPVSGITRNPWNLKKTPGGSSCGAVASVATGVTPFALGTDGGGVRPHPVLSDGSLRHQGTFWAGSDIPCFRNADAGPCWPDRADSAGCGASAVGGFRV